MEFRHLRCFLAVAEELHFARAAEKLHIEQSPLSRAIKELEEELGTRLFIRNSRHTRLSRAGQMFLERVPRIFTAFQQARESVKAVAAGYDGQPTACGAVRWHHIAAPERLLDAVPRGRSRGRYPSGRSAVVATDQGAA
ncbi:LysR family transcriptional regulator [Pandoraea sp. SD6-2]|nr:LysR family transcriptional regulator [Pandoraea sp. SD6-2]